MLGLEAWETELFDIYNSDRRSLDQIEADLYAELDSAGYSNMEYGDWDSAEESI